MNQGGGGVRGGLEGVNNKGEEVHGTGDMEREGMERNNNDSTNRATRRKLTTC